MVYEWTRFLDTSNQLAGLKVDAEDISWTLEEVATATTLTTDHFLVLVDATLGNITITLPAVGTTLPPAGYKFRMYTIKKVDGSGNKVTIIPATTDSGVEKIDGYDKIELGNQGDFITQVSSKTAIADSYWHIIGGRNVLLEETLKDIKTVLESTLINADKLLYLTARMERYLDDSTDTEVEKHKAAEELREVEVDVR